MRYLFGYLLNFDFVYENYDIDVLYVDIMFLISPYTKIILSHSF